MEDTDFVAEPSETKMSKVKILRVLITDKISIALREILAVVETTVAGYESEVLLLKRELGHKKKQLHAILQPQVNLHRIEMEDSSGAPHMSTVFTDEIDKDELRNVPKVTEIKNYGGSEKCKTENRVDGVTPKVSHEETLLTHEESDCTLSNQPNDDSVSRPSNREEGLKDGTIDDVQNTRVKRRRLLPGRYRLDNCEIEKNQDNERKLNKKLQSSTVKNRHLIELRIGLLKNCPEMDLSNNAVVLESPVQTLLCRQNISKSDFINQLRSTFPELGENKPFEAFLADSTNRSVPNLTNKMTHIDLYTAFRSHEQKQFDFFLQLKEQEDTCDTVMNTASTALDYQPSTSGLEEEMSSETGGTSKLTNEPDLSYMDSAGQSEDDVDDNDAGEEDEDDSDFEPEQKKEEENSASPKPEEKIRKQRARKKYSGSCKVCGYLFRSKNIFVKHALTHLDNPDCKCGVCGQQLFSSEELKNHLETHQKFHQCDTCGQYFLAFVAFQRHVATHKAKKWFKCHFCQEVFLSDELLKQHHLHHKNDAPNKSDICPQSFQSKLQLQAHGREHTREMPYCCDECGKSLATFRSLSRHLVTHTGKKNYSCDCGKQFSLLVSLKKHEKIHTVREKTYLCDICSKSFYELILLKQHQKIHDKSHIHKCNVCDKLFKGKGTLVRHMRIHTGERKFSCKECGKAFTQSANLKHHMNIHLGLKPFTCTVCGYTCSRKHYLDSHMMTHTGLKPYKCTLCNMAFTQSHCLKTHFKSHQTEAQSAADALNESMK